MKVYFRKNWTVSGVALLLILSTACNPFGKEEGCTDPNALNYDPDAEVSDGSCQYPSGQATDTIASDINADLTLENKVTTAGAVDYLFCGDLNVDANLVIEAGVVIEFCAGASLDVGQNGSLKAIGEAANPIIMRGETQTPGFWDVLQVNANNPDNILRFVKMTDGGGDSYYNNAMIWLQNANDAQLTLQNCTLGDSKGYGLYAEYGTSLPNFENNLFKDNGDAGLRITSNHIAQVDTSSSYDDGNGEAYILVGASDLTADATWRATDAPYFIDGVMDINAEVTVQPGANFLMGAGAGFNINKDGFLNMVGTASNVISIKGETETPGFWDVIEVNSNNPNNVFENVEIAFGGGSSYYNNASLWIQNANNAQFEMKNCTVRQSYGWGMYVESGTNVSPADSAAMISANNFLNNGNGVNADCTGGCNVNGF